MLLLVSPDASFGKELLNLGVLNLRCHADAAVALCRRYDVTGVCIDACVEVEKKADLCAKLRAEEKEIPILFLTDGGTNLPLCADSFCNTPAEFLQSTLDFCRCLCHWRAVLQNYYLTVGTKPEQTYYLGYALPLSPTEHRILRHLFFRAPKITSSAELLAVCFPEGTQTEQNLTVQISSVNRKARTLAGRPLIRSIYRVGYTL